MSMTDDEINKVVAHALGRPYADAEDRRAIMTAILEVAARELSGRGIPLYLPQYGRSVGPFELPKAFGWIAGALDP